MKTKVCFLMFLFLAGFLSGCASKKKCVEWIDPLNPNAENLKICEVADPLEPLNRCIFKANDFFLIWFINPIKKHLYDKLPAKVREGVGNFFKNITAPVRFVSSVMQGKPDSIKIVGEFMINSSFGFFGIFNVAKAKYTRGEDIGQGLSYWGVGEGLYIVWPFFGPRTLRSSFGDIGSFYLSPMSQLDNTGKIIYSSGKSIDKWESFSRTYFKFKKYSLDPYTAFKRAYIDENRRKRIRE